MSIFGASCCKKRANLLYNEFYHTIIFRLFAVRGEIVLKLAIIDSIKQDRDKLSIIIEKWFAFNNYFVEVFTFANGNLFLNNCTDNLFDLIFIDVHLETMTGIETAKAIRERSPHIPIVFVTAHAESIFEAVHLHIFDYIMKPYTFDQISNVLYELISLFPLNRRNPLIKFSSGKKNIILAMSDILYITADNNYTIFTTKNGIKRYRIFFSKAFDLLTDKRFILCTRGVAVNMDYIDREEQGTFKMKDGRNFPIHRNGRREVIDAFEHYQQQKD